MLKFNRCGLWNDGICRSLLLSYILSPCARAFINGVMGLTPVIESKLQDSDQRKIKRTSHTGEDKLYRRGQTKPPSLLFRAKPTRGASPLGKGQ